MLTMHTNSNYACQATLIPINACQATLILIDAQPHKAISVLSNDHVHVSTCIINNQVHKTLKTLKMQKDEGLACQKVYEQGRDNA